MKVYLDDVRPAPEGWTLVKTVGECVRLLDTREVEELSLDYHLESRVVHGDEVLYYVKWMLEDNGFAPPKMYVHTSDKEAKGKMLELIAEIEKIHNDKEALKCCGLPSQCWEPCGYLGKSEEHAVVASEELHAKMAIHQEELKLKKRGCGEAG